MSFKVPLVPETLPIPPLYGPQSLVFLWSTDTGPVCPGLSLSASLSVGYGVTCTGPPGPTPVTGPGTSPEYGGLGHSSVPTPHPDLGLSGRTFSETRPVPRLLSLISPLGSLYSSTSPSFHPVSLDDSVRRPPDPPSVGGTIFSSTLVRYTLRPKSQRKRSLGFSSFWGGEEGLDKTSSLRPPVPAVVSLVSKILQGSSRRVPFPTPDTSTKITLTTLSSTVRTPRSGAQVSCYG